MKWLIQSLAYMLWSLWTCHIIGKFSNGKAFNEWPHNPGHLLLSMKLNLKLNIPKFHISQHCQVQKVSTQTTFCMNELIQTNSGITVLAGNAVGPFLHYRWEADWSWNHLWNVIHELINSDSCVHIMIITDEPHHCIGRTCHQPSFLRWRWVPGVIFLTVLWPQSDWATPSWAVINTISPLF